MGLTVEFATCTWLSTGETRPPSWQVMDEGSGFSVLDGFATEVDAMIARDVLSKMDVDWHMTLDEWNVFCATTGLTRRKRMELVCEHLRW